MIDFRSDTVTKPTKEMREAMANAIVGDDVYEDDPTIKELEELAAKITGKEAALFVTSGTMGNQLAIMTHTNRGDEIIVGRNSHVKNYEVGAAAVISQVSYHLVDDDKGMMDIGQIRNGVRQIDVHYPTTSLICLENAHGYGTVAPVTYMKEISDIATQHNISVHLDGARLFNAATHLDVPVNEITKYVDSVTFCLSKGLACPVGSILCGSQIFIDKARRNRKLLGGGMRQVGVLGAAGLVGLKKMTQRLHLDHENAKYLAHKLSQIKEVDIDFDRLDINMVFLTTSLDLINLKEFMLTKDIKISGYKGNGLRLAVHNDISRDDIDKFIEYFEEYVKTVR